MNFSNEIRLDPEARRFYQRAMRLLIDQKVPFLVGGAYAFNRYTGIQRHTKDFDIFVLPDDNLRALRVLSDGGYRTELTDSVWLGKAFHDDFFIDVIFGSANGVAGVDGDWFEHSVPNEVLSQPVLLVPPEEMIWQKSFILERDRFDGADIAHIIKVCADKMNWSRLRSRFGDYYWKVLFVQLVLFSFVYPAERDLVPAWIMQELTSKFIDELAAGPATELSKICFGTIFSATQYSIDLTTWGYADGSPEHAQRKAA